MAIRDAVPDAIGERGPTPDRGAPGPYRPRAVPAPLRPHLVCRWDATMVGAVSMIPDGCVELMWLAGRGLIVCGPETTGWAAYHRRPIEGCGVRLRPGIARAVLGVPVHELRDRRVALDEILPGADARRTAQRLADSAPARRSGALLELIHARLRASEGSGSAPRMTTVIEAADGMAELADTLSITPRQLHRRSLDAFGYGPATLRSVLRLQRFLALRKAHPSVSLALLAAQAGYADQSHLVRDSRRFSGMTPSELVGAPQGDWHGDGELVDVREAPGGRSPARS